MKSTLALCVLVASVGVHWPIGRADFSFDDRDFVESNASIRTFPAALAAFAAPFPPDQPGRALYRPLTNLSYAVDHAIWGDAARGYHLTNVLLYLLVVLSVHRLALRYLASPGFALSVALLFSLHPVHADAVDSISGRSELLSMLFWVTSLQLCLRATGSPARRAAAPPPARRLLWAGSVGAYLLACLSKESAALLPAVLAAHLAVLGRAPSGQPPARAPQLALVLLPHFAVFAGYLAVRSTILGGVTPSFAPLADSGIVTRIYTAGAVFLEDLRLLILPDLLQVDFYYQHAVGIVREPTPSALLGLSLLAALIFFTTRLARAHFGAATSEQKPDRATALCGLAIFGAFLLPVSHLIDIGTLMAERLLLSPSLGFLLCAVLLGRRLLASLFPDSGRRRAAAAALLLAVLSLVFGARSALRAAEWRDEVRLWTSATRALPYVSQVHTNLAAALLERGEIAAAAAAIERAREIDPGDPGVAANLGVIYLEQGRFDDAQQVFETIVAARPDDYLAWNNLGIVESRRANHPAALALFQRALDVNPNYQDARRNLLETQRIIEAEAPGPLP